jgi:hypothetical protein
MTDRFEELLKELSALLGIPLHPDRKGACKLVFNETLHVQLECDAALENLLIAAFICDIPPGKFRENILKDALKANSPFPKVGTLAYSERNNKLTLFTSLRISNLTGHKLAETLSLFVEKANLWRTGVETGHTAQLTGK